jgi:hypothetical protein
VQSFCSSRDSGPAVAVPPRSPNSDAHYAARDACAQGQLCVSTGGVQGMRAGRGGDNGHLLTHSRVIALQVLRNALGVLYEAHVARLHARPRGGSESPLLHAAKEGLADVPGSCMLLITSCRQPRGRSDRAPAGTHMHLFLDCQWFLKRSSHESCGAPGQQA